jgi:hypothetical protein
VVWEQHHALAQGRHGFPLPRGMKPRLGPVSELTVVWEQHHALAQGRHGFPLPRGMKPRLGPVSELTVVGRIRNAPVR